MNELASSGARQVQHQRSRRTRRAPRAGHPVPLAHRPACRPGQPHRRGRSLLADAAIRFEADATALLDHLPRTERRALSRLISRLLVAHAAERGSTSSRRSTSTDTRFAVSPKRMAASARRRHANILNVRFNPSFSLDDVETVKRLIRENPWATIVSTTCAGLVASHYPVMLDEQREEISVLSHVGKPDEELHELGQHEVILIVQGPHGYISPKLVRGRPRGADLELHRRSSVRRSGDPLWRGQPRGARAAGRPLRTARRATPSPAPVSSRLHLRAFAQPGHGGLSLDPNSSHGQAEDEPEQVGGDRHRSSRASRRRRPVRKLSAAREMRLAQPEISSPAALA